ncbi:MAG: septum formation initiator family protein [Pseudomonadota bacterium]
MTSWQTISLLTIAGGLIVYAIVDLGIVRRLANLQEVTQQIEQAQGVLDETIRTRQALQHQVDLLRTSPIDHDMLDEQARRVLGLAAPSERVYLDVPPTAPTAPTAVKP